MNDYPDNKFAFATRLSFPCLYSPDQKLRNIDPEAKDRYGAGIRIADLPADLKSRLHWMIARSRQSGRENVFARSNKPIMIMEQNGQESRIADFMYDLHWLNAKPDHLFIDIPAKVSVFSAPVSRPMPGAAPVMLILQAVMVDIEDIEKAYTALRKRRTEELFFEE